MMDLYIKGVVAHSPVDLQRIEIKAEIDQVKEWAHERGFAIVPFDPTDEMALAGWKSIAEYGGIASVYKAMIAAAWDQKQ